jgi:hypothetical protein
MAKMPTTTEGGPEAEPAGTPHKKNLARQIERINDECEGDHVSVIVQMHSDDNELRRYLADTSEAIRQQLSAVSARALIPPPAERAKNGAQGQEHTSRQEEAAEFEIQRIQDLSSLAGCQSRR